MNKHIFILAMIAVPVFAMAQSAKWKPWVSPEMGLMAGSYSLSGDFRLQGGVTKNGWMLGAGGAYDPYRFKSVPVYAQVRKMIGAARSKPFIMGSFGTNINTEKNTAYPIAYPDIYQSYYPEIKYDYSAGIYAEAGGGWAFTFKKGWGINLSLSYTHKSVTESHNTLVWTGSGTSEKGMDVNKYLMNRINFRIGLQF